MIFSQMEREYSDWSMSSCYLNEIFTTHEPRQASSLMWTGSTMKYFSDFFSLQEFCSAKQGFGLHA